MTKTPTEQWREGTLEQRYYYVKYFATVGKPFVEIELKSFLLDLVKVKDRDKIEVLAAVPSYDEYNELLRHSELSRNLVYEVLVNQKEYNELLDKAKEYKHLQKQLEIATKALKEYANSPIGSKYHLTGITACIALKEMEGVK